jgi:hypothetical protein
LVEVNGHHLPGLFQEASPQVMEFADHFTKGRVKSSSHPSCHPGAGFPVFSPFICPDGEIGLLANTRITADECVVGIYEYRSARHPAELRFLFLVCKR